MNRLLLGVLLFSLPHLAVAVAPALRHKMAAVMGNQPFRGLFSLLLLLAIYLMASGWSSASTAFVYTPLNGGRWVPAILMFAAAILFFAPYAPNNLKRFLRHPQLLGVLCWSAAHLLSNGDSRSLVLFGGLGAWAILQIVFLNRRDGAWQRPARARYLNDMLLVLFGAFIFSLLAWFHGSLFGVPPFPNLP
jgi:uncharacterized membrane protein